MRQINWLRSAASYWKACAKGSCNVVVMASKAYLRRKEAKIDAKSRL